MRKPFYGWIIVGVTFLIGVTEAGAFQNILSIFLKPMTSEFGWSRSAVSAAMVFGSLSAGMVSPMVGSILDRHGPRMVAFWGILILSAGLACMFFLKHIWQLYLFFGVGRMIAMSGLGLVVSVTVSNWFIRKRGRAMGIVGLGSRIGAAILPALTQFFILTQGWRIAWAALGVTVFLLSGIPSLLFLRRRPEDIGLLPDGEQPDSGGNNAASHTNLKGGDTPALDPEPDWSRSQAIRTTTFWALTAMESIFFFVQAGTNFHIYPYLTDQGLGEAPAVLVLSTFAFAGALGSLAWGAFTEKIKPKFLLIVNGFSGGIVFLLLFWVVRSRMEGILGIGLVFLLAAFHGLLHGGRFPVLSVIWADFFGRKSLGSIYGFTNPFRFTANAIGPIFGAICFDFFGNYAFPFYTFTLMFLVTSTIGIFVKLPRHPQHL